MLFASHEFIFFFLPTVLLGYWLLAGRSDALTRVWLVLASLFFYGWWDAQYVPLLVGSILFNFFVGRMILGRPLGSNAARLWMILGVAGNLALLGYFKYANFFLDNLNLAYDTGLRIEEIILPLGISFFTFTQIAYLVDCWRGQAKRDDLSSYAFFVTFFPHLLAGPILHHAAIMPQVQRFARDRFSADLALGLTIFAFGLFKKVMLADSVAAYGAEFFNELEPNQPPPGFFLAWQIALASGLQLYFDFSGYSDMAIGLARMFGVNFPINFHSPFKATSMLDYWRRWHITLTNFLRHYLFHPMGGTRKGALRGYINIFIVMFVTGVWHGAGWTFAVWGAVNGVLMVINMLWLNVCKNGYARPLPPFFAWLLTFIVLFTARMIYFSPDMNTAFSVIGSMYGLHGWGETGSLTGWILCALLLAIALGLPNVLEMTGYQGMKPASPWLEWSLRRRWGLMTGAALGISALFFIWAAEFLYFQF